MIFCRRSRPSLFTILLAFLGFKVVMKERMSEESLQSYRAKRRQFRSKLREAFDVWDEGAESASDKS